MKFNKLIFFIGLITNFLIITNSYAINEKKVDNKTKFINIPTDLAAKSFAIRKFGRNIDILSNRFSKKSGCYKIVIRTRNNTREVLKICPKSPHPQLKKEEFSCNQFYKH